MKNQTFLHDKKKKITVNGQSKIANWDEGISKT